ncbi:MAG: DMT family transporter [Phycisphaerae bacterium]|nr:DMT family transporter [Phycisphaerae bacterium]
MLDSLNAYVGPAAAVATSVLWTATSILFTAAGRRIGATVVNGSRIILAIILLGVTHRLIAGVWVPPAIPGQIIYLALSGIVGLAIGDQALFTAFVLIGPRLSMLVMTTSPLMAAVFGWVVLGEALGAWAWIGIALTVGGVGWVVFERPRTPTLAQGPHRTRGLILAFIGAACQAGGLLLSKQGIGHGWLNDEQHLSPQAATLLRMFFAGIGFLPIYFVHRVRERKRLVVEMAPRRVGSRRAGYALTICGAIVGPYLGVWMSLVAADNAPVGVAQTLSCLSPIFILPFAVLIHKEHLSPRAIIGALVAVGASTLLFFAPA